MISRKTRCNRLARMKENSKNRTRVGVKMEPKRGEENLGANKSWSAIITLSWSVIC